MVQRLTNILHLDRNIKFFVLYGPCVADSFITDALTEVNIVSLLDEYLNEHGFKNNIVYNAEKTIRFLRRSEEEELQEVTKPKIRTKSIDLRKVPGAGRPPLDHPVISASEPTDRQPYRIAPDDVNRYISWSNCVDYFNSVMMLHQQKKAIIFMDAQNCRFDQRFLSCFSKWQIFSRNGSIFIFIYPGEEPPRTLGFLESENRDYLISNGQLLRIGPPEADEVRNLLLRMRLFRGLSLDWNILDNFCKMFAGMARDNLISIERMKSDHIFGGVTRLDQTLLEEWKEDNTRPWMCGVGIEEIKMLHNKHNERGVAFLNEAPMEQSFSPIKGQDDNVRQIIEYLSLEIPKSRERPMSMLFAGMTGTGKTFTAELIAKYMKRFGYGYHYETMTNYKSEHDASRFVGSAEGFVGSDSPPAIITKRDQFSGKLVIVLDEFDKAHPSAQDMIMQLLDKGVIQSNKITADFRQSLIILTSNAADRELVEYKAGQIRQGIDITEPRFVTGIKEILRTHKMADTLLARLGLILVYNKLSPKELTGICWNEAVNALKAYDPDIRLMHIDPNFILGIISSQESINYGARPIRHEVNRAVSKAYRRSCNGLRDVLDVSLVYNGDQLELVQFNKHKSKDACLAEASKLVEEHNQKIQFIDSEELKQALDCVVCQDDNIAHIVSYLRLEMARKVRSQPVSMLFSGMTGTGKTYTAELIAKYLERHGYGYHYETMTNYRSEHDASRFVGSADGFVGSDSPPAIIAKRDQFSGKLVIVLDEFDKAHQSAQGMIMQLLDKGIIQSNKITADFTKSIVILTSNAADRQLTRYKQEALLKNIPTNVFQNGVKDILRQAGLQDTFLGRLGKILVFNPLGSAQMLKICWQEIENFLQSYEEQFSLVYVDPAILVDIVRSSGADEYGARAIRNLVRERVGAAFANYYQDISGEEELALISDGEGMVLRSYSGEATIEECLAGGLAMLDQKAVPPPEQQPAQFEKIDYQHLLAKGCKDAAHDKIEDIVKRSVGLVEVEDGSGSGFVITTDGLFVTCCHVVSGCQEVKVRFEHDLELAIMGRVIAADAECDLALLKLEGNGFQPGPVEGFGEAVDRRNEEVLLAGYPLPDELGISKVNFTKGNVSNVVRSSAAEDAIIHYHLNCNAYPGNSGGPVFSMESRQIVGILKGGYDRAAQGVNVAVSIQSVYHKFFKDIMIKDQEEQECQKETKKS